MAMAASITAAIVEAILMRPEFVIGARVAFPFAHDVVGLLERPVRVVETVSISCREVAGVSSEGLICAGEVAKNRRYRTRSSEDGLSLPSSGRAEGHPYKRQPKKGGLKPPPHGNKKQEEIQWEGVSWR